MSTKETTKRDGNEAETKRTQGEWIVDEETVRAGRTVIATMVDEGWGFAPWDERAANAVFIVRAVNAHDELVGALREVREWCDLIEQNYPEMRFTKSVRAALEKAGVAV